MGNGPGLDSFAIQKLIKVEPAIAPPNTLGLRALCLVVWKTRRHCRSTPQVRTDELVGEVAQYEDKYRLCYLRVPGIIVALAEELSLKRLPPEKRIVAPRHGAEWLRDRKDPLGGDLRLVPRLAGVAVGVG